MRCSVPLSEEAPRLFLGADPAFVVRLHRFKRLLHRLLKPIVPQFVDVLLKEVVDLAREKKYMDKGRGSARGGREGRGGGHCG